MNVVMPDCVCAATKRGTHVCFPSPHLPLIPIRGADDVSVATMEHDAFLGRAHRKSMLVGDVGRSYWESIEQWSDSRALLTLPGNLVVERT
jgi:hypothetical protein